MEALLSLSRYLDLIVEPTLDDFQKNQSSVRHAFISCVVVFHAIDRLSKKPANLRQVWRKQSIDFAMVDLICHTLKHVETGGETPENRIPWTAAMPGAMGFNTHMPNESGPDVRQIYYLARSAVTFIRKKADEIKISATLSSDQPPGA
jgi:hypothetical protein